MSGAGRSRPAVSLCVVVVDDFASLRELVRDLLTAAGHEVVGEAADGHAGVRDRIARSPDVVIMDWRMPELDGVEATRQIVARVPGVRVIAFSSAADPGVQDAFFAAGAAGYIDKSDVEGLLRAIAQIAETTAALRSASSELEITVRALSALARTDRALRGAVTAQTADRLLDTIASLEAPGRRL